tara:strand:+ start:8875 stop:9348 length:474 start_codon:yes stop_codon:yes gene_type:complete
MKKTLLISGQLLFCVATTSAQEVVSTLGESYSNSSGGIEFTVGELMISTYQNGSNGLTQGFHQTKLIVSSTADFTSSFEVRIFPNPVMYHLNINLTEAHNGYRVEMLDINGKLVKSQSLFGLTHVIDVSPLAAGIYMLILKDEEGELLKTYQVHKLN